MAENHWKPGGASLQLFEGAPPSTTVRPCISVVLSQTSLWPLVMAGLANEDLSYKMLEKGT